MPGPLNGLNIIELAGLGPDPFAGALLANVGADVGANVGANVGATWAPT